MTNQDAGTQQQLRSTVRSDGTLELSIATVPIPKPEAAQTYRRPVAVDIVSLLGEPGNRGAAIHDRQHCV